MTYEEELQYWRDQQQRSEQQRVEAEKRTTTIFVGAALVAGLIWALQRPALSNTNREQK